MPDTVYVNFNADGILSAIRENANTEAWNDWSDKQRTEFEARATAECEECGWEQKNCICA